MKRIINMKSNLGFTMVDIVIALIIILLFTGIITSLMFSARKMNAQITMSGNSTYYAMLILEDIDKISYDEVQNGMEDSYITKYSIPSKYQVSLEVSDYTEDTEKEDLIKKIKLTIAYDLLGDRENVVINRLKVKEI